MALVVKDRVRETSTTTGTGTITLNGAVTGFQSFLAIGNGNTTYYTIVDAATGDWEVGIGTYSSGVNTLSRTTVLESSNAGNLVDFPAGTKDVFCTYPAERSIYTDAAGTAITPATASVLGAASGGTGLNAPGASGNILTSDGTNWTSAPPAPGGIEYVVKTANYTTQNLEGVLADTSGGAFTVTLPATPSTGDQCVVADAGSSFATNNLTVGRNGSTIASVAEDLVLNINGVSVQFVYDGSTWEVYAQVGGNSGTLVTLDGIQTLTNKTLTSPAINSPTLGGTTTVSSGTANGVAYLNGSKALTTGSALTFDGTNVLTLNAAAGQASLYLAQGGTTNGRIYAAGGAGTDIAVTSGRFVHLQPTDSLICYVGGSEQMRLTSTGLGIGTSSPATKLHIAGEAATSAITIFSTGTTTGYNVGQFTNTGGSLFYGVDNSAGSTFSGSSAYASVVGSGNATNLNLVTNATVRATLDSSGNLGLGVTPSAWASSGSVFQAGSGGGFLRGDNNTVAVGNNFYYNGTNSLYKNNGYATRYEQYINTGIHAWFTAPSGTAGNAITFTQSMTLDASGNLVVGASSASARLHAVAADDARVFQIGGSSYALRASSSSSVGGMLLQGVDGTGSVSFQPLAIGGSVLQFLTNGTSERARITSNGDVLVGTTAVTNSNVNGATGGSLTVFGSQTGGGASVVDFYNTAATGADASPPVSIRKAMTTTTSSARFIQFYANGTATAMGGIVGNGASNVQFASISDAREKTNITSISGSLSKVLSLNPVEFDWLANGEHCPAGFVAQDVEQVFPEFVVENMAGEDQEPRKGLTGGMTGGIVAHLVKAIQEQQQMINELRAEVASLKGA